MAPKTPRGVRIAACWLIAAALTLPGVARAQDGETEATLEDLRQSVESTNETEREFVILPIPVSNPSIGSGLGLAAMALYRPGGREVPWTSGVGGMYTDSGSWAAGLMQRMNLADDRFRITALAGLGDFHLDFYGIGADAGSRDVSVAIEQEAVFATARGLMRFGEHAYVGPMLRYLGTTTTLDLSDIDLPPALELPEFQLDSATFAVGVAMEYDSRDSQYGPTRGTYGTAEVFRASRDLGGDFDYTRIQAALNGYRPWGERTVVASRIAFCDVGDGAPFYDLCSFGSNADLRGYVSGQYRDHALIAGQVELRRKFSSRFGAVLFAGIGTVAPSVSDFDDGEWLPAAGIGLRYLASESYGVNLSVDYAVGRDSHALYFRIGEAF